MKGKITKRSVAALKPGDILWDTEVKGFGARCLPSGTVSYAVKHMWKGRQRLQRIGTSREVDPRGAREIAKIIVGKIVRGIDPRPELLDDRYHFGSVVDLFISRYAKKNTRRWDETERIFRIYVTPTWGTRSINEISRSDVTALLDRIEDRKIRGQGGRLLGGEVMADQTLSAIRKLFHWHESREGNFVSPIVKGMSRSKPGERARTRVLSDDEIKIIWPLLEGLGAYGAIVKLLLLTAQRRSEVSLMRRSEIDLNGIWSIPEERSKNGIKNVIPLPIAAREIVDAQPSINGSDLVFTSNGEVAFNSFSKAKARLDQAVLTKMREQAEEAGDDPDEVEQLPNWTIHDLRRTAKTLMARAGVRPDISERVLNHVIGGVEGIYDRHDYVAEKLDALEVLATAIERILNPPADNVVAIAAR